MPVLLSGHWVSPTLQIRERRLKPLEPCSHLCDLLCPVCREICLLVYHNSPFIRCPLWRTRTSPNTGSAQWGSWRGPVSSPPPDRRCLPPTLEPLFSALSSMVRSNSSKAAPFQGKRKDDRDGGFRAGISGIRLRRRF